MQKNVTLMTAAKTVKDERLVRPGKFGQAHAVYTYILLHPPDKCGDEDY